MQYSGKYWESVGRQSLALQVALPSREPVWAGGRGGLRGARRYHGPCLVQQHGPTPRPSYLRLAHARPCDVARPKLSHNVTTGAQEVGGWLRILFPLYQLVEGGGYKVWISPSWRSTRKQTAVRQFVSKREFYVLVDLTNRRSYKSYIPQFRNRFLLFHNHLQNSIFQICLPDINIWF